jgi:hypothetical protein
VACSRAGLANEMMGYMMLEMLEILGFPSSTACWMIRSKAEVVDSNQASACANELYQVSKKTYLTEKNSL